MNVLKQKFLEKQFKVLYEYGNKDLIMYKSDKHGIAIFYCVDEKMSELYFEKHELETMLKSFE